MLLGELLKSFSAAFKAFDISNPLNEAQAISYLNRSTREVYRAAAWNFRKKFGTLTLVPKYSTGSCSIVSFDGTNDEQSRTINFSGASLTSDMRGRFIRLGTSSNYYRIISISGSTVYVDSPVIESSGSYSFVIWKRFYSLNSDVDAPIKFRNLEDNLSIEFMNENETSDRYRNWEEEGQQYVFNLAGSDEYLDSTYSEGTVSGSENSDLLTGAGTHFIGNVGPGDIITINNQDYWIKRVLSPTSVQMHNHLLQDIAQGSGFSVRKNFPLSVEFTYSPSTYKIVTYSYLSSSPSMINTASDVFPMPFEYHEACLTRAKAMKMQDDKDPDAEKFLQTYTAELNGLKEKKNQVIPRFTQFSPKINRLSPGRR